MESNTPIRCALAEDWLVLKMLIPCRNAGSLLRAIGGANRGSDGCLESLEHDEHATQGQHGL